MKKLSQFTVLIGSCALLQACSSYSYLNSNKPEKRIPASFTDSALKDPQEVKKYFETLRLLGGSASLTLSSGYFKVNEGTFSNNREEVSKQAREEVESLATALVSKTNLDANKRIVTFEESDACVKWEKMKVEEIDSSSSKKDNMSSFGVNLSLSSIAAALATGGVYAESGDVLWGLMSGSSSGASFFSSNMGLRSGSLGVSYNSNVNESKARFYYMRNNVVCMKYNKYMRAVINLTPDILNLDPQYSAERVYIQIDQSLDALSMTVSRLNDALTAIIDSPVIDDQTIVDRLGDFKSIDLMKNKIIGPEKALALFSKEYSLALDNAYFMLQKLSKDSVAKEYFNGRILDIKDRFQIIADTLASLDADDFSITHLSSKKRFTIVNKIGITRLKGVRITQIPFKLRPTKDGKFELSKSYKDRLAECKDVDAEFNKERDWIRCGRINKDTKMRENFGSFRIESNKINPEKATEYCREWMEYLCQISID